MNAENNTHLKTIGYILWLFGFTGSHRFYYGKPITGILYFFTFGLFLIGWIIDLFLIPAMDRQADLIFQAGVIDYNLAWILLTFLGLFGVHRMYMGKWITGILYPLTGGLLGMGYLYEFCTSTTRSPRSTGRTYDPRRNEFPVPVFRPLYVDRRFGWMRQFVSKEAERAEKIFRLVGITENRAAAVWEWRIPIDGDYGHPERKRAIKNGVMPGGRVRTRYFPVTSQFVFFHSGISFSSVLMFTV